jgi:hypothetical protein
VSGERAVVRRSATSTYRVCACFRRNSAISAPIHFVFSETTLEFVYYRFRHTVSSNGRVYASFGKVGQSSGKWTKVQRARPWYRSFKPDPNRSINDSATTFRSFRGCPTRPATFDIFRLDPTRNHRNNILRPASLDGGRSFLESRPKFRKVDQSTGGVALVPTLQTRTQSVEPSLRYDPMTFVGGGCRKV